MITAISHQLLSYNPAKHWSWQDQRALWKIGGWGTVAIVNTHQSLCALFPSIHTTTLNNVFKNKFKYRNVPQKDISMAIWKLEDWMLL
jgi:hypothetical protein